ncbi:hypothetical protein TI04_09110, partial [Achromatium sp. WMS2]
MSRVVITGLGAITSIGTNVKTFFANLLAGRSGIVDFRQHPEAGEYRLRAGQVPLAALLPEGIPERFSEDLRKRFDPQALTVLAAAQEALVDANFTRGTRPPALFVGSAVGLRPAVSRIRKAFPAFAQFSVDLLPTPSFYGRNFNDEFAISSAVRAIVETSLGPAMAFPFSTLCASGGNAVILGYEMIRCGLVDAALAIGFDFFHPRQNQVFSHFRLLDTDPMRPFDASRKGYQLGEAVGAVMLESMESAARSEINPYAEVVGVGASNDGYHMVIPDPSGSAQYQAIMTAINEAKVDPAKLDVIAAVGRGSKVSDQAEARAFNRVLGKLAGQTPINSLAPNTGYTLGASSILNLIALCMEM